VLPSRPTPSCRSRADSAAYTLRANQTAGPHRVDARSRFVHTPMALRGIGLAFACAGVAAEPVAAIVVGVAPGPERATAHVRDDAGVPDATGEVGFVGAAVLVRGAPCARRFALSRSLFAPFPFLVLFRLGPDGGRRHTGGSHRSTAHCRSQRFAPRTANDPRQSVERRAVHRFHSLMSVVSAGSHGPPHPNNGVRMRQSPTWCPIGAALLVRRQRHGILRREAQHSRGRAPAGSRPPPTLPCLRPSMAASRLKCSTAVRRCCSSGGSPGNSRRTNWARVFGSTRRPDRGRNTARRTGSCLPRSSTGESRVR
jgi:hypothetical protein